MTPSEVWQAALDETMALAKQASRNGRTINVSPEVAALLESVGARTTTEPVGMAAEDSADEQGDPRTADLKALADTVRACQKCGLCETRTQTVFSDGSPYARLVFVGEAPGGDEDRQGVPFVGRAGQLLTDIIVKGMKMNRSDVYICNVLKCRPPENRNPTPAEVEQCEPYLIRQLELIQPKVICALGLYAAQSLLKTTDTVGRLRGKWHTYHGIPLRVTYHPAYLLRNPEDKAKTWADVQEVMKVLDGSVTL
ncbi:MAG: uracil-DNA glycosylase [Candidatus Hydrogenedentes bacterium]|nr:uracil-DNA glycosylase [Candidatus Hydrogenedentota bacterium]